MLPWRIEEGWLSRLRWQVEKGDNEAQLLSCLYDSRHVEKMVETRSRATRARRR